MGHNKNSKKGKKCKEKELIKDNKSITNGNEEDVVLEVDDEKSGNVFSEEQYAQEYYCNYCPMINKECNYYVQNEEHSEELNRVPPGGGGHKPPVGPPGGGGHKPPVGPPGGGGHKPPVGPPGGGGHKPPFIPPHGYPPYFGPDHFPPYYNGYYPTGYPYIVPIVINGIPQGAAPNYIPSIYDLGVQSFSDNEDINICLYQYTYIWESGGDSYWAYLSNLQGKSVSGYRYLGNMWVDFKIRFKDIDYFICYRSNNEQDDCPACMNRNQDDVYDYIKLEYSKDGLREVYCKTLSAIDIPEIENDYILQTAGIVEDKEVKIKVPTIKTRNISYRTILEVSYPDSYDNSIKEKIIAFTDEIAEEVNDMLYTLKDSNNRYNPLDLYNKSVNLILDSLKTITASFTLKLQNLNKGTDWFKEVTLKIRKEKINNKWKG